MAIPDFQRLTLPLLRLAGDGREHTLSEAIDRLAHDLALSNDDRAELLPSGKQPRFDNRVGWAATYLRKAGLLRATARGRFDITDRGREVLAEPPDVIDIGYLARFPGVREFRARDAGEDDGTSFDESTGEWTMRPEVAERVRKNMERAFPDAAIRLDVLRLMAFAIENADEDYLYLGQLLTLVSGEMWQHARDRFGGTKDAKQRLTQALEQIAPVRNEIAHVREVTPERLMRANLACGDLLELMRRG